MEYTNRGFENLYIWQEARVLVKQLYTMMEGCRDWGFKDQIQRAAVSIMNNIAEGADSGSDSKFTNFLNIARGSCAEVRSMLFLCEDLNICSKEQAYDLRQKTNQISAGINKLIKSITKPE